MVEVKFFALTRELVGEDAIEVALDSGTVESLRQILCARGEPWRQALSHTLVAVNHQMVAESHQFQAGDEVAFFPPVTGG
uniref:molybdopterin converting factor subunit 1 n=1 Tax=Thaumasiovibrio occultus TaxID=1891184 RepID=UPI000B363BB2|nr:molybdopterin converting factor subunit 1 [Thaumasiovibrio occultus]